MNNIVERCQTKVYISDSCPVDLGGMSIHGRAWIYHIPMKLQGRVLNSTLKYLAEIITIWVDTIEGRIEKEDCILALSDSSSAIGWTF
eukprot:12409380-Ditylum_brightwellii.AAC.1